MDAWFSPLTTQTLAPHPLASRRKLLSGPYPGAPAGAVFGKKQLVFFFFSKKKQLFRLSVTDSQCVVGNKRYSQCVVGNLTLNVWLGLNVTLNVWLGI